MIRNKTHGVFAAAMLLFALCATGAELRLAEGTNFRVDVSPTDGRLVIDLLGSLWILPSRGGDAQRVLDASLQASRPRWSPDGTSILFESRQSGSNSLWQLSLPGRDSRRLSPEESSEQDATWHPSGERITYTSATDTGIDLWERDLKTGASWQLTHHDGDVSSPAWSADGRHLVYLLQNRDGWRLMLRRFGQPASVLYESSLPLYAPAWRPDNTLVTFLSEDAGGQLDLYMTILSDPPVVRRLAGDEDFFVTPVAWRDRSRMLYTADGVIKTRRFEDRESTTVPFSAAVGEASRRAALANRQRPLPQQAVTRGDLVIRASRLFDGISDDYQRDVDIVITGGRITAIEAQRDRGDAFTIDIADTTVMPGLIDSYAALPANIDDRLGPLLLSHGVTTVLSPDVSLETARTLWESGQKPGPRVLVATGADQEPGERDALRIRLISVGEHTATGSLRQKSNVSAWRRRGVPVLATNWSAGLIYAADFVLGTATLPVSPAGHRYRDVSGTTGASPLTLISGLAGRATPGMATERIVSVHSRPPGSDGLAAGAAVILGSRPSGLPPGWATQAELLALRATGMPAHAVLAAATGRAAAALRMDGDIGRIEKGARADLILVSGNPLLDIGAASQVIAVVRDGNFHSAASLREQAASENVE